jgi:hypothetical protein
MWYVLASFLLLADGPELSECHERVEPTEQLWRAVRLVARDLQLVSPSETWDGYSFPGCVAYCRLLRQQLRGAPSVAEAEFLPDRPTALAQRQAAWDCRDVLALRLALRPWDHDLREALSESRRLCVVWECIALAADGGQRWADRRERLQWLRDLLGPEAYYAQRWPAAVPWWRFRPE